MKGGEAITILKKDNEKCWIFDFNDSYYLFVKYDGDLTIDLLNEEEIKNEIVKLSREAYKIIKNKRKW